MSNELLGLLVLLFLIVINGFFVAAEYSLVSSRRTKIDQLADEGNAAARRVQRALGNLNFYIAAIQLGITVAALATGYVAEPALGKLIEGPLLAAGLTERTVQTISLIVALFISTVLSVIFAELVPKSLAIQRAETVAMALIVPLNAFATFFGPISRLLSLVGARVVRLFGVKAVDGHHGAHSEEEIRMIVQASQQQGVLEEEEKQLLNNVFDFSDRTAREIMTPRVKVIGIEAGDSLRELVALNAEHGYSRFPVYRDTLDNIIGIAHMADVLKHVHELGSVMVEKIIRPTFNAPDNMKVPDLFKLFQKKKIHMGTVVDEHGGTSGVVTLEDVLEELVGEIYDETDEDEEPAVLRLDDGSYSLDASLNASEIEDLLDIDLDDEEDAGNYDTLAGFMLHRFGYIPKIGEETEFGTWAFRVTAADDRKVSKVRVSRKALPPEELEGGRHPTPVESEAAR